MTRCTSSGVNERGIALVATLLLLLLLAVIGTASLTYSVLDLKSTAHFNTGNQALYTAESGVEHALSAINNLGVNNFNLDIVQRWSDVYGTAARTIPGYASFSYQVAVAANGADPANRGTITATGFAPLQAQRIVRVGVVRRGFGGGTGAIHLASDNVDADFDGNSFMVDGNNHDWYGTLQPTAPARPGISTRNDAVTTGVVGSLSTGQKDNVIGLGFSLTPLTPSVLTIGGPGTSDIERIKSQVLSRAGVVNDSTHVFNNGDVRCFGSLPPPYVSPNCPGGTGPQITHLTDTDVTVNGNITGVGILIVDGSLDIRGTIDFIGWILVRGSTKIHTQTSSDGTSVLGSALVKGSLWTGDFDVEVGGSAIVDYCEDCLALADAIGGGGNVPRAMQVTSWGEL